MKLTKGTYISGGGRIVLISKVKIYEDRFKTFNICTVEIGDGKKYKSTYVQSPTSLVRIGPYVE